MRHKLEQIEYTFYLKMKYNNLHYSHTNRNTHVTLPKFSSSFTQNSIISTFTYGGRSFAFGLTDNELKSFLKIVVGLHA